MSEPDPLLSTHPFLAGLGEAHLARLSGCCRASLLTFSAGSIIFSEGESAQACYLLREGSVALQVHVPGTGARTIQTLHGGDVLGWSWLFPPFIWSFDARSVTAVEAIGLDAGRLMAAADEDRVFGYELMRRLAGVVVERLQATRLQLLDVYGDRG